MPRSRLVFDRLKDFPPSEIDTVIPLTRKILQPIKSLRDLTRQLVQCSGKQAVEKSSFSAAC
jgi:predicted component of type VI protein secretion system